ncbi:hypothetical protein D9M70_473550 [compost metagenome]
MPWADRHRRDPRQLLGAVPGPAARPVHHRPQLPRPGHAAAGHARPVRRHRRRARPVEDLPRQAQRLRRTAHGCLRRGAASRLGRHLARQRQRAAVDLPPVRQRLGAQGVDRRDPADPVADGLPAARAHLLPTGGQLRRVRQRFAPGADAPVLRPDPQRRRGQFPPPDAGGVARRLPRRLVPEQRQAEDVAGLPAHRRRHAERSGIAGA